MVLFPFALIALLELSLPLGVKILFSALIVLLELPNRERRLV